jgi:hypothetical protein
MQQKESVLTWTLWQDGKATLQSTKSLYEVHEIWSGAYK